MNSGCRYTVRIPAKVTAVVTEVFRGFCESYQSNAEILSSDRFRTRPFRFFLTVDHRPVAFDPVLNAIIAVET
jgi:hypothetical protein